jgi:hypothetical protein
LSARQEQIGGQRAFTVHRSPVTVHRSPFSVQRSAFGVPAFTVQRLPFGVQGADLITPVQDRFLKIEMEYFGNPSN